MTSHVKESKAPSPAPVERLGTAWLAPVDWSVQYDSPAGLLQLVDHRQDGIVKG